MEHEPKRICIYVCVTDIDGCPQRRHLTVGDQFCQEILGSHFNSALHPASYDHVHIPGEFDSLQPLKRWFILDLAVRKRLGDNEVSNLPHEVYLASKQDGKL